MKKIFLLILFIIMLFTSCFEESTERVYGEVVYKERIWHFLSDVEWLLSIKTTYGVIIIIDNKNCFMATKEGDSVSLLVTPKQKQNGTPNWEIKYPKGFEVNGK